MNNYEGIENYKRQTPKKEVPKNCEWCNQKILKRYISKYLCEKCSKIRKQKKRQKQDKELEPILKSKRYCIKCKKALNINNKNMTCDKCRNKHLKNINKMSKNQYFRNYDKIYSKELKKIN